ncbi:MAG TPA: DoxX family protein [Patescibacteria group bacterium]|nr:DoxX family protein [Patescibacteria group bacterium]
MLQQRETHSPETPPSAPKAPGTAGSGLRGTLDRLDRGVTAGLAVAAIPALRIALGIVFLWFGALKFVPGLSPAEDLAGRTIDVLTFGLVTPEAALPVLALWEVLIGVGLLTGRFLRFTLALLAAQIVGTVAPLVLFPAETFTIFPIAPTLTGQYILKNVVLFAAAMVVGSTVRGNRS